MKSRKKTTVQADPETLDKLRVLAASDDRSMASYLRQLVDRDYQRWLRRTTPATAPQEAKEA